MFEKHEKWFILGIIALVIFYLYKKGKPSQSAPAVSEGAGFMDTLTGSIGSLVNPTTEPGSVQPAQATQPLTFRPAQPSTVPISQRVGTGTTLWMPAQPVLRTPIKTAPIRVVSAYQQRIA